MRRPPIRSRIPILILVVLLGGLAACDAPYDTVILGGTIIDGSGGEPFEADLGIRGDRIEAIGSLSRARADRVIDATALYLAPGFIDLHSHAEAALGDEERSVAEPLIAQGITTVVVNADGRSPADLVEQRNEFLEHGLGVNVAQLVGHNTARTRAMDGSHDRAPTPEELDEMRAIIRAGMEAGAFGLSTGLFYTPSSYSETDEVIALAEVAAEFGGMHSSHIRDESDYTVGVVNAVQEIIDITRATGVVGIVSHIKALGPNVWGDSEEIVARIQAARDEGLPVWADQYPYAASQTSMVAALFPAWSRAEGDGGLRGRLDDPVLAERIRAEIAENLVRRGGADRLQFTGGEYMGRTLQDYADDHGMDGVEAAIDIVRIEAPTGVVSHNMNDDDILRIMRQPWTATSTDGVLPVFGEGMPHPRGYGAFARKIRKYVVEEGAIELPFAIRSMTAVGAEAMGLEDRGRLEVGAFADVVVFDLEAVNDPASYMEPHQLSEGMVWVLVNGVPVIEGGVFTGAVPGRVLLRDGSDARSDRGDDPR